MRTTLSLDEDVAALLKRVQVTQGLSFKDVVNAALRQGLQVMEQPAPARKPFQTRVHDGGKCYFPNLNNTQEVLEEVEGPWHR